MITRCQQKRIPSSALPTSDIRHPTLSVLRLPTSEERPLLRAQSKQLSPKQRKPPVDFYSAIVSPLFEYRECSIIKGGLTYRAVLPNLNTVLNKECCSCQIELGLEGACKPCVRLSSAKRGNQTGAQIIINHAVVFTCRQVRP